MPPPQLDYQTAFDLAPLGWCSPSAGRSWTAMPGCLEMFAAARAVRRPNFAVLYPSPAEFERTGERIAARLDEQWHYADDRVMKRLSVENSSGATSAARRSTRRTRMRGIWSFEDLSAHRQLTVALTPASARLRRCSSRD